MLNERQLKIKRDEDACMFVKISRIAHLHDGSLFHYLVHC